MPGSNLFAAASATVDAALVDATGNYYFVKCPTASIPSGVSGYAKGCILSDTTAGLLYTNTGTSASCTFTAVNNDTAGNIALADGTIIVGNSSNVGAAVTPSGVLTMTDAGAFSFAAGQVQTATVTVSVADIISGTTMKQLVAAPASGKYIQLISASIAYTYATAAYTGGGNVSLALGTTVITGVIAAANSFGKGSNAVIQFSPTTTAGVDLSSLTATALNINVATGTFTQPGTAAGTAKVYVTYVINSL